MLVFFSTVYVSFSFVFVLVLSLLFPYNLILTLAFPCVYLVLLFPAFVFPLCNLLLPSVLHCSINPMCIYSPVLPFVSSSVLCFYLPT